MIKLTKIKKSSALQPSNVVPKHCVCQLTLDDAIKTVFPKTKYAYKAGPPGTLLPGGKFVSLIGEVGTVIYAYCDFKDKKGVPLSKAHMDHLYKLKLILCQ